jgi:hypothetical protein
MPGSISLVSGPRAQSDWVRWMVVNLLLNSTFGSPGRMR